MPAKREFEPQTDKDDPETRYIGFKAYGGADQDIIDWWKNIPQGEGSGILRDLIRRYALGQEVQGSADNEAVLAELAALREMVEWIGRTMAEGGFLAGPGKPRLSEDEIETRKRNVKASGW